MLTLNHELGCVKAFIDCLSRKILFPNLVTSAWEERERQEQKKLFFFSKCSEKSLGHNNGYLLRFGCFFSHASLSPEL